MALQLTCIHTIGGGGGICVHLVTDEDWGRCSPRVLQTARGTGVSSSRTPTERPTSVTLEQMDHITASGTM